MTNFEFQPSKPRWASPEAERKYLELLADAQRAAKLAAQPYLDEASKLACIFMTFEPVILKVDEDDH